MIRGGAEITKTRIAHHQQYESPIGLGVNRKSASFNPFSSQKRGDTTSWPENLFSAMPARTRSRDRISVHRGLAAFTEALRKPSFVILRQSGSQAVRQSGSQAVSRTSLLELFAAKVDSMTSRDDTQRAECNLGQGPSLFFLIVTVLASSVALEAICLSLW
jgi:hypothetical protein